MKAVELFENEIPEHIMLAQGFYLAKGNSTDQMPTKDGAIWRTVFFDICLLMDDRKFGTCYIKYDTTGLNTTKNNPVWLFSLAGHQVEVINPAPNVACNMKVFRTWVLSCLKEKGFPDQAL